MAAKVHQVDPAFWIVSVMAKLQLLRTEYRTDPKGIVSLSWATVKFNWNPASKIFYGSIIDTRIAVGNTHGAVIPRVDPFNESVDVAAAKIDREMMRFLGHVVN